MNNEIRVNYTGVANILVSAIEVYPKETFGFLAGSGNQVVLACPVQVARRGKSDVWITDHTSYRRTRDAITSMSDRLFGTYHSHPRLPAEPSDEDLESALTELSMFPSAESNRFLMVIVGIQRKENPRKSKHRQRKETIVRSSSEGDYIGAKAYCGRYLYEMRLYGYWVEPEDFIRMQYPNVHKAKLFYEQQRE